MRSTSARRCATLGYADEAAVVNRLQTERARLPAYASFAGFEEERVTYGRARRAAKPLAQ